LGILRITAWKFSLTVLQSRIKSGEFCQKLLITIEREYQIFIYCKGYGISINFFGILLKVSTTIQTRYKKGSRGIKGFQYIKK
jgi:hypothetical protein